jgi:hypothetical protein
MNVEIERVTNGPVVNESLETTIEGVFACGNVLHVHDLVDYVSEEAKTAGANAARYVKGERAEQTDGKEIKLIPTGGVRYTVPAAIRPECVEDKLTVRFRVGDVFKNSYVSVYFDEERVQHRKKVVIEPGQMEQVVIKKEQLDAYPDLKSITVKIEEA